MACNMKFYHLSLGKTLNMIDSLDQANLESQDTNGCELLIFKSFTGEPNASSANCLRVRGCVSAFWAVFKLQMMHSNRSWARAVNNGYSKITAVSKSGLVTWLFLSKILEIWLFSLLVGFKN